MDARKMTATAASPTSVSVQARAAGYRRQARAVLDGAGVRLKLILAVIFLLVVAIGLYMAATGLYAIGYVLVGEALWLDAAAYGLMGVLGVTVLLPLAASAYRLACLAVAGVADSERSVYRILYPFTSRRAYGRCMAVGGGALGWFALIAVIPAGGFWILASLFDRMANSGVLASLCSLMTFVSFAVCLAFGVLMLLLSGRRAGFGYLVFSREELSLGQVNRLFRGCRRGFALPFALRVSLVGWVALSVAAVLIPFVIHTIPYALCCRAVYGKMLNDECRMQN